MSDNPTPLKSCPTPWKNAYRTRGEALKGFHVAEYTRFHRPYLCCCGKWHMTSHPRVPRHGVILGYSQPASGNGPGGNEEES